MRTEKQDEKRTRFRMLLFRLALNQDTLSTKTEKTKVFSELKAIYAQEDDEDFRHFYSDIFAVLSQIEKDPSLGNLEILAQNMEIIRRSYMYDDSNGDIDISKQINKLYDHINLEIARINYFKTTEMRSQEELGKVSSTLEKVNCNVKAMEDSVSKADEIQKQYITILGIFASIVLTFTGGIAFSTSVLENMNDVSIYRIVLIAIGLAFVLMNLIYILTRFILEVSKKDDEKIEYPGYMKNLNRMCIIAVIIIVVCWFFDVSKGAKIFQEWFY